MRETDKPRERDKDKEQESETEWESAIKGSKEWIWGHWRKQEEEVKNSGDPLEEICSCANRKAELNSGVRVGIGELYLMPVIFNEAARELKTRKHSMIRMVRAEQSPGETSC